MDADLFLHGVGATEDSYSEQTKSTTMETDGARRKFGTNLTRSSVGNREKLLAQKSAFVAKSARSISSKKHNKIAPLSIQKDETFSTLQEVKSRFHSSRNVTRNLELEGSLKRAAEKSTTAAALTSSGKTKNKNDDNNGTSRVRQSRAKYFQSKRISSEHCQLSPLTPAEKNSNRGQSSQRRTKFASSSSLESTSGNSSRDGSRQSYKARGADVTVHVEPGPIGVKLEPVVRNGEREFGCRVIRYVESKNTPSQARLSSKINIGDILIAIDGRNKLFVCN